MEVRRSAHCCAGQDGEAQGRSWARAAGRPTPTPAALPDGASARSPRCPICACSTGGSLVVGLLIMVLIRFFNLPLVEGLPGG